MYIYFEKRICHPSSSSHFLSASGRESSVHSLWLCRLLFGALFQVYPCNSYLNRMLKDLMFYKPNFKTRSMEMGAGKNLNDRHPAARVIAVIKACVTKGEPPACLVAGFHITFLQHSGVSVQNTARAGNVLEGKEKGSYSQPGHFSSCCLLSRLSLSCLAQFISVLL